MDAKKMLEKVQDLKETAVFNLFAKGNGEMPDGLEEFFAENWVQILDILDDALYAHGGKENV